jgi:hypothetical protein
LNSFYEDYQEENYLDQMKATFDWFMGDNHLHQIIYNPRTGGCYDGLEQYQVNLNQGAESTVSYLMARLTMESMIDTANSNKLVLHRLHLKEGVKVDRIMRTKEAMSITTLAS